MPPLLLDTLPGDAQFWENIRDGQTRTDNPLRVGYTCEIIEDWRDPMNNCVYRKGMPGKVLAFNKWCALVGLQGLEVKCKIPSKIIKGGPVPSGTWAVQGHEVNLRFAPPKAKDIDIDQQFPKAVHAFLSALQASKFPTLGGYISLVGEKGEKVEGITKRIAAGVRDAGLLDVLNTPTFTVQDIERNASLTIGPDIGSQKSGVYLRIYMTTVGRVHDNKTYVGKAKDFSVRYSAVTRPSGEKNDPKHWKLHQRQDMTAVWVALCILDGMPDALLHLTEQVFVCLLETYRSDIIASGNTAIEKPYMAGFIAKPYMAGFIANASYMSAAAQESQQASKWPGATFSRPQQYGATEGMNLQSPLFEILREKMQLIRTDMWFQVSSTMEIVPIANFRRAMPRKANWNRLAKTKDMQVIAWINIGWTDPDGKAKKWAPASTETDEVVAKGVDVPGRDTQYGTVFEVRLDGKPHPMSYMRGPKIPVFMNSGIANSWALRIEWKDPNGVSRSRYIHPGGAYFGYNVPGAARGQSEHYLRCISLIHYLFNAPYQELRPAYFNMGPANVLQVYNDFFLHKISFGPQMPYPTTIDYSRVSDASQIQMMVGSGLKNVNIPWSDRPLSHLSLPQKCDSCVLEAEKAVKRHMYCEQKGGVPTNVCTHCYDDFGRAACSFTPHRRLSDREDEYFKAKFRPLLHIPPPVSKAINTVDPELQLISAIEEDEVSDGEMDM